MADKHTKGPWKSIDGTTTGKAVTAPNEPKVRRNVAMVGGPNRGANARLIAAAPDMLEALLEAPIPSKYHGSEGFDVDQFLADYAVFSTMKRDAIAVARGEI